MIACAFVLSIWMHFGLLMKCHAVPDILTTIMDEFRIYQPFILGDILKLKEMVEVVKNLNYHGYSIGFSQKQLHMHQSCVVFIDDITQFKWNNPTYVPILVVTKIKTEDDLKKVDISIGSEVLFLDWDSLKVYESYTINKIQISRYLGQFQASNSGMADAAFVPSIEFLIWRIVDVTFTEYN